MKSLVKRLAASSAAQISNQLLFLAHYEVVHFCCNENKGASWEFCDVFLTTNMLVCFSKES